MADEGVHVRTAPKRKSRPTQQKVHTDISDHYTNSDPRLGIGKGFPWGRVREGR